jgi:hypothetical protein
MFEFQLNDHDSYWHKLILSNDHDEIMAQWLDIYSRYEKLYSATQIGNKIELSDESTEQLKLLKHQLIKTSVCAISFTKDEVGAEILKTLRTLAAQNIINSRLVYSIFDKQVSFINTSNIRRSPNNLLIESFIRLDSLVYKGNDIILNGPLKSLDNNYSLIELIATANTPRSQDNNIKRLKEIGKFIATTSSETFMWTFSIKENVIKNKAISSNKPFLKLFAEHCLAALDKETVIRDSLTKELLMIATQEQDLAFFRDIHNILLCKQGNTSAEDVIISLLTMTQFSDFKKEDAVIACYTVMATTSLQSFCNNLKTAEGMKKSLEIYNKTPLDVLEGLTQDEARSSAIKCLL